MALADLAAVLPVLAAASYCAGDFFLRPRGSPASRHAALYEGAAFLIVALALFGDPAPFRVLAILVLAAALLIVHGYRMLTGDTLRPESLLLAKNPDHLADAVEAAWTDFRRVRRIAWFAALWAIGALAATLVWPPPPLPWSAWLLAPAAAAILIVRGAMRSRRAYPRAEIPGFIGLLSTVGIAAASFLPDKEAAAGGARYRYDFTPPDDPILIAVIMGESIAPDRMSLFQPQMATVPKLLARSRGGGRLAMFWRLGFSGAVSSNASVTGFLSGTQRPEVGAEHQTLFELAKSQGFQTAYLSPQTRSPLLMSGRLQTVDVIKTRENSFEAIRLRDDHMINDALENIPPSDRDFFFLYQRVNHSPYYNHDETARRDGIDSPRTPADIIHNYDLGLGAWDRHLDSLLSQIEQRLEARPGTRCFVFVTSDHNELLGTDGFWGHNISGRIDAAVVPMMLFTNAPEHPVAHGFAAAERIDAFALSRLAMQAMGVRMASDSIDPQRSFVGNALPFGRAGHMTVQSDAHGRLEVEVVSRTGRVESRHTLAADQVPGIGPFGDPAALMSCRRSPANVALEAADAS